MLVLLKLFSISLKKKESKMSLITFILCFIYITQIYAIVSEYDNNFIVNLNYTECGPNFELLFEIFPVARINDIGGIMQIGEEVFLYFDWLTSTLVVSLPTNQGNIELRSSRELVVGEWTAVKVNIQRRSIAIISGGNSYVNDRISVGHMHSERDDTSHILDNIITAQASAAIKNFVITCTSLVSETSLSGTDFGAAADGRVADLSELYRKVSLYDCNTDGVDSYKINTVRMTSLNGSSDPYIVVHVQGAPIDEVFNIRVKLRSKSSQQGYKYIIPAVALPAIPNDPRGPTKNYKNFAEVELSGYMGKNHLIAAGADYNMRIEVLRQVINPQPSSAPVGGGTRKLLSKQSHGTGGSHGSKGSHGDEDPIPVPNPTAAPTIIPTPSPTISPTVQVIETVIVACTRIKRMIINNGGVGLV